MVVLDSLHLEDHVKAEIAAYKDLVTVGSYLIVEDGDAGGHPVHHVEVPDGGPGAAIRHLLDTDARFAPDRTRERYFVTQNPHGYSPAHDATLARVSGRVSRVGGASPLTVNSAATAGGRSAEIGPTRVRASTTLLNGSEERSDEEGDVWPDPLSSVRPL